MKNIEQELLKIATENVNKKLEEERKKSEEKIKSEIQDVNFILELIEKKMLYKVVGRWSSNEKFIMVTKDIFLKDYTSEPKTDWHKKGIRIENWHGYLSDNYDFRITINDEITYSHIGYIIKDFIDTLKEKKDRIYRLTEGLNDLEKKFEDLSNQETNIIKFVENYNEIKKQLNKKD